METSTSPDRSRRPRVAARSILLADANRWGFALPSSRLRPEVVVGVDALGRPTQTIRLVSEFGYPLEIRRLIEDLRTSCDQDGAERQYEALIRLAIALILRAHEIDRTEAASLLEMDAEDLPGFVEAVLSVISGDSPIAPMAPRVGDIHG